MILRLGFAISVAAIIVPTMAGAAELASHRAVYDMELIEASEKSGLTGVRGRMVYEFRGSECEGYAVRFRSVAAFGSEVGEQVIDQRATTFENPSEERFSFTTQTFNDNELDKEVKGEATRQADGVSVSLSQPSSQAVDLPEAFFPVSHMQDLLRRAQAGERIYKSTVFDGTENGDQVLLTNIVIGDKVDQAAKSDGDSADLGPLADGAFWPISMSYYNISRPASGEDEPIFRLSFDLYVNGVSRDYEMDYGEFTVGQKLVELDALETPPCKESGEK
ncbi:cell envelope integrity EipB family protein [Notoacmeibacter ruber]|nr:cell envelope integrity EipB family protein [Notoacmeibacter ruber]